MTHRFLEHGLKSPSDLPRVLHLQAVQVLIDGQATFQTETDAVVSIICANERGDDLAAVIVRIGIGHRCNLKDLARIAKLIQTSDLGILASNSPRIGECHAVPGDNRNSEFVKEIVLDPAGQLEAVAKGPAVPGARMNDALDGRPQVPERVITKPIIGQGRFEIKGART